MENNHLTYIKVENFKKFDVLEVSDIGQFNLIVGDNNVGKTCLLEALLVDDNENDFNKNLASAFKLRGLSFRQNAVDVFRLVVKSPNLPVSVTANKHKAVIKPTGFIDGFNVNIPLIGFGIINIDLLVSLYDYLQTKKDKQFLIETLQVIFPDLENIEFKVSFNSIENTFIFQFKNNDNFVPLNFLGDGFKRIFYITLMSINLKNKRLMIDEIEIGIHFSKQKDFFINLFKICKELNVQLFATTHSKECEEAFIDSSKYACEKDIRLIKLKEKKDKSIKAITYPFQEFEYLVESETETR